MLPLSLSLKDAKSGDTETVNSTRYYYEFSLLFAQFICELILIQNFRVGIKLVFTYNYQNKK